MTVEKFNHLVHNGYTFGVVVERKNVVPPFSCGNEVTNEIVEFEGYKICYQDKSFLWMTDKEGNAIKREDCTMFDVNEMDDEQLALLMADVKKTLKKRQLEQASKAVFEFNKAWNKLKEFGEVRVRVSATGETHFHTTVERLSLEIMPLK